MSKKRGIGYLLLAAVLSLPSDAGTVLHTNAETSTREDRTIPRVSKNQSRQPRPGRITANPIFYKDVDSPGGPGPNNNGATQCYADRSCSTTKGYQCKEYVGRKCYAWLNSDGIQRCASCN